MGDPVKLSSGTVFAGDFKVVRPLRTGGQGSLYVVEQLSTSKLRALKLMLPELVAQPKSRQRFELEAKIAARIQSDHVVESIASGVDAATGVPWLVMELLEGQDLAAYTQEKKRLPPAEVLEIFSQLCHALGEAHKQGIVHRDIKPENIFLATARRRGVPFMVKVLDFGIARIMAEAQTVSSGTQTGLGTPMWMAPEQAIPGAHITPSTDVWPLGLIAFRLLTGYLFWKAPYDPGASVMMLMAEAFMHPLPTASDRAAHYNCRDRLPLGFDTWFAKCVARPMEERFADAAAAFAALEPILMQIGQEASLPERPSAIGIVAPAPSSRVPSSLPLAQIPAEAVTAPAPEPERVSRISTVAGMGPARTGPGLPTWGAVPELGPGAVLSVADSSATADQAPPVQTAAPAPSRPRRPLALLVTLAVVAGVILGGAIFASQRGRRATAVLPSATAPAVSVVPASPVVSAPASVSAPAVAEGTPAPSACSEPARLEAPASSEPAQPEAPASAHVWRKLCKQVGAKCLVNEDCCERTCRKWICRTNASPVDPYGDDK